MNRKLFLQSLAVFSSLGAFSALQKLSEVLAEEDEKMPVLFMGHGSPMNAIEANVFSEAWRATGAAMPKPKAVLCISAHWLTRGVKITAMEKPRTIHDFGGFPQALFDVEYPALGHPELAQETQTLLQSIPVSLDHDWGLDHGAWSVLKQMYPNADVPVLQLSIDYYQPAAFHYTLGKSLSALRKKGVLILGSGNMVHNLGMLGMPPDKKTEGWDFSVEYGYDWALEMQANFRKHLLDGNHQALIDYQTMGRAAQLAIPTPDHYFPLLYTLGLQEKNEALVLFNDVAVAGSITMTSLRIG